MGQLVNDLFVIYPTLVTCADMINTSDIDDDRIVFDGMCFRVSPIYSQII